MKKFKSGAPLILFTLLPAILFIISGCSGGSQSTISETGFKHKSGIKFDFPSGWSPLSKQEWQDMNLGENKTLITIMDANREAGFSLIPVNLDRETSITLNLLGNEPAARAVMFLQSMHMGGKRRYEEYEMFSKGGEVFAGLPVAEIIYQGRNPGKNLKWYRVLALTATKPANSIIMMMFTAPIDEEENFEDDFNAIEASWKWRD